MNFIWGGPSRFMNVVLWDEGGERVLGKLNQS